MSVRINLDELTDEQKKIIRKHLYMQPKQIGRFMKQRYVSSKDPILLYSIDKPNNEIILPYTYANSLLKRHINSILEYPYCTYDMINEPRDYQQPVLDEALKHLVEKGTTTLGLYPGWGKTYASAYLASKMKGLALVVFPTLMIKKGWISTFEKFTNAKVWVNEGNNYLPEECNVILTMDTIFHKIPIEVLKMVKTLVIDEAHVFCVPSRIQSLLGCSPKYIIACTATLERRDGMHTIIQAICGTHGIFLKTKKNYIVHKLETGVKTEITLTKNGNPDWAKLVVDLAFDPLRNAIIIDLVERNVDHKILILTWNVEHAHFLSGMLNKRGTKSDVLAGKKSDYKDTRVLVATCQKAGYGFDESSACENWGGVRSNMLILTGSTKSLVSVEQQCGRVFRSDTPIIIDLVDDNRICKGHWRERLKYYEHPDQNGTIIYSKMYKDDDKNKEDDQIIKNNHIKKLHQQRLKKLQKQ